MCLAPATRNQRPKPLAVSGRYAVNVGPRPERVKLTCHCCNGETKKLGRFQNKNRLVQRFRCIQCGKTFSEDQPLEGVRIESAKAAQVIHMLCEGVGIRAIARLAQVDQKTVLNILQTAGAHCNELLDAKIRNVDVGSVQCDELFSFVYCKEKKNVEKDPTKGDQYTWLAVDRKSKLVLTFFIGKRERPACDAFVSDLKKRIKGRFQVTTDGYTGYNMSFFKYYVNNLDFAQQVKTFSGYGNHDKVIEHRYSVGHGCTGVQTYVRSGNPDRDLISTSHVERMNLSVRLFNRRFTRLTLGYSKKLDNLVHATALFIAHFNFCRVHSAVKIKATETTPARERTPAMAAGLTDHVWTAEELISAI